MFWYRLLTGEEQTERRTRRWRVPTVSSSQASATIFLVLRRMRAPLIVLIVIFAVGTLGLTLIPGQDAAGRPWRMGFFDAFYVMSYTASTIGFGEIPYAFTYNQRMWVTISIYLTVVGWAYAIGSLLALVQERSFRQALALQHFTRKVRRLGEPFLLIAGYGQTGQLLARSLDALGRRFVVIDGDSGRIDDLYLDSYHADVPGLVGDAGDPGHLAVAGLGHPHCEGVLAITDNDEANLAVTQAAALLRPDLPVITRTVSPAMAARMQVFGSPTVVNPFDRFGDHLRIALRAPASYQLLTWLESGPGAPLPKRGEPPSGGHWIVCGYGRFGREVTHDLRAEGYDVTIVEPGEAAENDPDAIVGFGYEPPARPHRRGHRARRRFRGRYGQRHHEPVARRRGTPREPPDVRRRPAEQAGQRAAVRGRRSRRAAGTGGGGRARGVRAAVDPAALAVPARVTRPGRRLGRQRDRAADRPVRHAPAVAVEGAAQRSRGARAAGRARPGAAAAGRSAAQSRRPRRPPDADDPRGP